jgi:hypothetical protein
MTAATSKRNLNVEFPNHSFYGDFTTDGFGEKKEQVALMKICVVF